MKFYEVQKALEEGKKIRRSDMEGHLIFEDRYEFQPKIRYVLAGSSCSLPYHIGESELLADDWEIIEEATIKTKTIKYITCPKCKNDLELTDIHVYRRHCGFCNTDIELKNGEQKSFEGTVKENGSRGQTIPNCISLNDAVKIADEILGSCKKRRR